MYYYTVCYNTVKTLKIRIFYMLYILWLFNSIQWPFSAPFLPSQVITAKAYAFLYFFLISKGNWSVAGVHHLYSEIHHAYKSATIKLPACFIVLSYW